jgi:transcriptional regulator with XRE-family HTH domain
MIKNERQYKITKAQADKFREAIAQMPASPPTNGDPNGLLLWKMQRASLQSQLDDLLFQLKQYDALRAGQHVVIEVSSFEELPTALIQARIAAGLSQKELAERLGLKEQQLQRYEATEYASASLERVNEVIRALNVKVRKDVFLPNADLSLSTLFKRLRQVGIDQEFIFSRLIPRSLRAAIETFIAKKEGEEEALTLKSASYISRVFGWSLPAIFDPQSPLRLSSRSLGAARLKVGTQVDERRLNAYTVYAHLLAMILLDATVDLLRKPIPSSAEGVRKEIIKEYGSVTFENALRYVWSLGIPVLPLNDSGAFHGACWRVEGRNVIVLKQQIRSLARWLYDLIHELAHAGEKPESSGHDVIEDNVTLKDRRASPEEVAAHQLAGDVVLNGRAQELAEMCVEAAGGSLERLKSVVPRIAMKQGVEVDSLANYLAFRLHHQGLNWWGAATNLQKTDATPLEIARNVLFENVDLTRLNEFDRNLLEQALTNNMEVMA